MTIENKNVIKYNNNYNSNSFIIKIAKIIIIIELTIMIVIIEITKI